MLKQMFEHVRTLCIILSVWPGQDENDTYREIFHVQTSV